ncbi:hypothetical protein E2562_024153 [Oryza meyeriana var. granulata]|uniref:Uncharacterized protein n=1 Tax=Oryza meyeriana var. granulata TaxID=110450 RepID=A0A6G1EP80_9ORYZ|nr:hypothetical protein E2562_024153 [Oryza meyeriana var. granulata]
MSSGEHTGDAIDPESTNALATSTICLTSIFSRLPRLIFTKAQTIVPLPPRHHPLIVFTGMFLLSEGVICDEDANITPTTMSHSTVH